MNGHQFIVGYIVKVSLFLKSVLCEHPADRKHSDAGFYIGSHRAGIDCQTQMPIQQSISVFQYLKHFVSVSFCSKHFKK